MRTNTTLAPRESYLGELFVKHPHHPVCPRRLNPIYLRGGLGINVFFKAKVSKGEENLRCGEMAMVAGIAGAVSRVEFGINNIGTETAIRIELRTGTREGSPVISANIDTSEVSEIEIGSISEVYLFSSSLIGTPEFKAGRYPKQRLAAGDILYQMRFLPFWLMKGRTSSRVCGEIVKIEPIMREDGEIIDLEFTYKPRGGGNLQIAELSDWFWGLV